MTYEKLNDHLDKKIADFNLKALAFIVGIFLKPLATATEPFFRKNMGERYFSSGIMGIGLMFWIGVAALSAFGYKAGIKSPFTERDITPYVACVFCFAYTSFAILNLSAVTKREKQGVVWHSLSRGESIFGSENTRRDVFIAIAVTLILSVAGTLYGLFFMASRIVSYYTAAQERASIYARYLDVMDAQIEAQHLEIALRDGKPPRITEGLYGPLPKRFKGEHRANVARVVAGGGISRVADRSQQPATSNSPQPPASPAGATTRAASPRPAASSRRTAAPAPAQRQEAVKPLSTARAVDTAHNATSRQPQNTTGPTVSVQRVTKTFSPEVLELLQLLHGAEYAKIIVEMKAATPEKLPPDDVFLASLRKMKAEKEEQAPLRAEYSITTGEVVPEGAKVRRVGANKLVLELPQVPGSPYIFTWDPSGIRPV